MPLSSATILKQRLRGVLKMFYLSALCLPLRFTNRFGRRSILSPDTNVALSLTSYGHRIKSVHLTIEAIARGTVLPSRMVLWLDDSRLYDDLPESIRRLQRRGLDVRLSPESYGPHTKYFPYVQSEDKFELPLVTADDDVLYPRDWLERLAKAYRLNSDVINCYRAHVVGVNEERFAPYSEWGRCTTTEPSFNNFATGVAGVIYPPAFLLRLKQCGSDFKNCCPKADDIWLHVQAIRSGFKIRQIETRSQHFPLVASAQALALHHTNVGQGGNDDQISSTYSTEDVELLSQK